MLAIVALLFAQMALAAYACPVTAAPIETSHAAMADAAHGAMPGCDEPGPGGNYLCLQHCQASGWTMQPTPQLTQMTVALMPVMFVEPVAPTHDLVPAALATLLERETSPPPLRRFCVLRI